MAYSHNVTYCTGKPLFKKENHCTSHSKKYAIFEQMHQCLVHENEAHKLHMSCMKGERVAGIYYSRGERQPIFFPESGECVKTLRTCKTTPWHPIGCDLLFWLLYNVKSHWLWLQTESAPCLRLLGHRGLTWHKSQPVLRLRLRPQAIWVDPPQSKQTL